MKTILFLSALALSAFTASAEVVQYKLDPVHSGIDFKIRHFINKMPGSFNEFNGEIHFDKANPENSKATATIQVASIDTRNKDRDEHLQNEDFFLSTQFPEITFVSTKWEVAGENRYTVTGDLTMLGKSLPVVLDVEFLGEVEGRGKIRSGWEGKGMIDRTAWGLDYGATVGSIGKEVEIEFNIQAHRQ